LATTTTTTTTPPSARAVEAQRRAGELGAIAALLPQKDARARLRALERAAGVDPARADLTLALLGEMTTTLWLPMSETEAEAIRAALVGAIATQFHQMQRELPLDGEELAVLHSLASALATICRAKQSADAAWDVERTRGRGLGCPEPDGDPLLFPVVVPPPGDAEVPKNISYGSIRAARRKCVVSPHCVKAMLLDSSRHPCRGGGSYGVPARSDANRYSLPNCCGNSSVRRAQERTQPSERPGEFGVVSTPNVRHAPERQQTGAAPKGANGFLEEGAGAHLSPCRVMRAVSRGEMASLPPGICRS